MTMPAVLLSADAPAMQYIVGGLPLLTRHLIELHTLGVTEFYLLGPTELPRAARHQRLPAEVVLHAVPCSPQATLHQQLSALPAALEEALVLWSQWLIDPRLLRDLLATPNPQWLPAPQTATETSPVAARLAPVHLLSRKPAKLTQWFRENPRLEPATLDTYSPTHRGPAAFYLQTVKTPDDTVTATKMLITSARKHTLDVIASLLDRMLVNRLVLWLSYTRITPNQVTLGTGLLGAVVSILFLFGWLRLGSLLTYAAVTLDGVDGKLARTTLRISRVGELEHVLDFFMEQSWYLAITIYLVAATGDPQLWWTGSGLMVCAFLVNILYGFSRFLFGKHIEELGPFDRSFRRIGGRRNIYMGILLIGFWTGFPQQALRLTLGWALLTLVVHMSQMVVYHLSQRPHTA
ncbi:hypothetical protein NKDENANG_01670 [Candidatus Entotheonellaceae bacterium PAL068K]